MSDPLSAAVIERLRSLRSAGRSIAQIVAQTGVSTVSIIKYTRDIESAVCECGRSAKHHGFCWARPASEKQKASRARLGGMNKKWTSRANNLVIEGKQRETPARDIAVMVNALLGRTDITFHAVNVRAYKLGFRSTKEAKGAKISVARKRYWERRHATKRASAVATALPVAPPVPVPKQPFRMMSMEGPDPRRPALLAAKATAGVGRV